MAYGQLESEVELETIPHDKAPPLQWPDKGVIKLHTTDCDKLCVYIIY